MKLHALAFSAVVLFSVAGRAQSNFNGGWGGSLLEQASQGNSSTIPGFCFGVTTGDSSVTFSEPAGYTDLDGVVMQVQGTQLIYHGHPVGTIDSYTMNIQLIDDINNRFDDINISVNLDGSLVYTDYLADYSNDYINLSSLMTGSHCLAGATHVPRGSALTGLVNQIFPGSNPAL